MRLLIAGDWHSDIHEEPLAWALRENSVEVLEFRWHQYFEAQSFSSVRRAQNKYIVGPAVSQLNADFLRIVSTEQPDCVFVYRGSHVWPRTIRSLRSFVKGPILAYNNDDAFSPHYPPWQWRHYKRAMQLYEHIYVYRHSELLRYPLKGAHSVSLLRSWADSRYFFPHQGQREQERDIDVLFVGHYEEDGRAELLAGLLDLGLNLKVYGPAREWRIAQKRHAELRPLGDIAPVWGRSYADIVRQSKIGLAFFSSLNRDQYTRRVFEITACKTALVAPRTREMCTLYEPDVEFLPYTSAETLRSTVVDALKTGSYVDIARQGAMRVANSGYDVESASKRILNDVEAFGRREGKP